MFGDAADEGDDREPADQGMCEPPIAGDGGCGAAGSSGDLSPPLPPPAGGPPGPDLAPAMRPRGGGNTMAVLFVTGGKLTFYTGARDTNLVAECGHICHGRCVKTKTMKGPAAHLVSKKGQGRPAGYLAAWLAKGLSPCCDSKAKH